MSGANETLHHRHELAKELAKSKIQEALNTRSFLGKPTTMSALPTSTKKSRAKNKRERQNRKKGRK